MYSNQGFRVHSVLHTVLFSCTLRFYNQSHHQEHGIWNVLLNSRLDSMLSLVFGQVPYHIIMSSLSVSAMEEHSHGPQSSTSASGRQLSLYKACRLNADKPEVKVETRGCSPVRCLALRCHQAGMSWSTDRLSSVDAPGLPLAQRANWL